MSAVPPPPPPPAAPPPPPPPPGYPPYGYRPYGVGTPPEDVSGVYYRVGLTILLMVVTFGIWGNLWTYRTSEDLRRYNGDGLGGVVGLVLYLLGYVTSGVTFVILMFTIPNEIKNLYERDGCEPRVTALSGLWFLLPIIGNIVWYVRVQHALNEFWRSKGSRVSA